ncbi:hypothetical protein [Mycolicibacterium septicum]|uniref:hypothetical protein n=1 Tax=Mycolicibacterium septicum TaxID=98668 RepID=UPI001AFAB6D7|nr:hypothetical protein [Mycolicibacterium septicum]QRY51908.1 hypothetical protein JVX95_00375 [Mycolicibacterium septicum]
MSLSSLRAAVFGVTGAALVTGMVACSSGSSTESPDTSAATSASESTSAAPAAAPHGAFTDCLTQHGIPAPPEGAPPGPPLGPDGNPLPPPTGANGEPLPPPPPMGEDGKPLPPPGVDQAQWHDAMQACQSLAPQPPPR